MMRLAPPWLFGRVATTRIAVFASAALVAACVSHTAPPGFLPDAKRAQTDVHGGWIDLTLLTPAGTEHVLGELIAVTPDSLWVLGLVSGRVVAFTDVTGGQLVGWDSQYGSVSAATVLGTLSTISNGFLLLFTAPMWIIGGSIAAASQSRQPIHKLRPSDWMQLRRFARFPQGLPPGLDFRELNQKQ